MPIASLSQKKPEQVPAPGEELVDESRSAGADRSDEPYEGDGAGCNEDKVDGDEQTDEELCTAGQSVHGPVVHRVAGVHLHRRVSEGQVLVQCGAVVCELQEQPTAVDEVP